MTPRDIRVLRCFALAGSLVLALGAGFLAAGGIHGGALDMASDIYPMFPGALLVGWVGATLALGRRKRT